MNPFITEYKQLQRRLALVREARLRGTSRWARDFWENTERGLIRHFNQSQGVDYAKLVL